MRVAHLVCLLGLTLPTAWLGAQPLVLSDLAQYDKPLTTQPGDPERGRRLVVDRQQGFCLLCHSGPFAEERFQGTMAPDLSARAGQRAPAQLRAQLLRPSLFNPDTIMPAYGTSATTGWRVHPQFQGKALLQPQDIEDIVAYLMQMKP